MSTPSKFPSTIDSIASYSSNAVREELCCPINLEPFGENNPACMLLGDGYSYGQRPLASWLEKQPRLSPQGREISSQATCPDRSVTNQQRECPITKQAFEKPYLCEADGYTYELDAICKYFETQLQNRIQSFRPPVVRSPVTREPFEQLVLYPNRTLWREGLPLTQDPIVIKPSDFAFFPNLEEDVVLVHNSFLRARYVALYAPKTGGSSESAQIACLTHAIQRLREELGLSNHHASPLEGVDFSHVDLAGWRFTGIAGKSMRCVGASFEGTTFVDCDFCRAQFINCNLRGTKFINCTFRGEEVSFYRSDLEGAIFEGTTLLEGRYVALYHLCRPVRPRARCSRRSQCAYRKRQTTGKRYLLGPVHNAPVRAALGKLCQLARWSNCRSSGVVALLLDRIFMQQYLFNDLQKRRSSECCEKMQPHYQIPELQFLLWRTSVVQIPLLILATRWALARNLVELIIIWRLQAHCSRLALGLEAWHELHRQ